MKSLLEKLNQSINEAKNFNFDEVVDAVKEYFDEYNLYDEIGDNSVYDIIAYGAGWDQIANYMGYKGDSDDIMNYVYKNDDAFTKELK